MYVYKCILICFFFIKKFNYNSFDITLNII